jgi:hypothetical protein
MSQSSGYFSVVQVGETECNRSKFRIIGTELSKIISIFQHLNS